MPLPIQPAILRLASEGRFLTFALQSTPVDALAAIDELRLDPRTAFILRRSLPWGGADAHGLYFVGYGATLDAFERQLRRMAGKQDGITDALLSFSKALTGGYYYCPPLRRGRLDLRAVTPRAAAAAPRSEA